MPVQLMDSRTCDPVNVGDVVISLERGDRLRVESISDSPDSLTDRYAVELRPVSKKFTAYAYFDEEVGGVTLDGYWLA